MSVEELCRQSMEEHHTMSLIDKLGHIRMVQPHILYEDMQGEKQIGYYFLSGYDKAEHAEPHWDSMKLAELEDGEIMSDHFDKRKDFDPFSAKYSGILDFIK